MRDFTVSYVMYLECQECQYAFMLHLVFFSSISLVLQMLDIDSKSRKRLGLLKSVLIGILVVFFQEFGFRMHPFMPWAGSQSSTPCKATKILSVSHSLQPDFAWCPSCVAWCLIYVGLGWFSSWPGCPHFLFPSGVYHIIILMMFPGSF